ncbi:MAG TPA: NAD-dependent succinate-semialdehyde dehydrogenase [Nitrososphaera sp.]|jgi:acyl-CoA reductase-like NAD-dependent aldehyde dehydrogenase|nr:NAD-dependent succinate-semialdehyde dehydrogenase [Nitrososphaera sp.]
MNKNLRTTNPATGEAINEYEIMSKEQIDEITKKAKNTFQEWKKDASTRAEHLYHVAHIFRKDKERLAKVITNEMGKVIKEARAEVEKCAWVMEYYADNGRVFLTDEIVNTDARKSFIAFEPLGVIGSIMPWNFPYWQGLRFASPSLMAGNTIVLKPASATMQCGIEIEKAFDKAGVPAGVFQTVIGDSTAAEMLIDSENVNAITFTGSVPVGAKVAQRATSMLKKTVLELGGSDPFIVCEDADIEKASTGAVKGRFINCGQSCIATKRFFVVKKIANEFIEKFIQKTEKLNIGDPLSDLTDIGPLVNSKSVENMESVVQDSVQKGGQILTGGERAKSKGSFYKPTLLKKVTHDMLVLKEETFGPIAPISIVENELEALKLANDSKFGLGASIWTQELEKAERLSRSLESGIVTVNNVVISDPRVPFGGIKNSGFGRELSRYGMLEFVNVKSVRFYDQLVHNHYVE